MGDGFICGDEYVVVLEVLVNRIYNKTIRKFVRYAE